MKNPVLGSLLLVLSAGVAAAQPAPDLRRSELTGPPSDRVVRRDIDGDGKPDMVERWWNGKRVRWLDENGDLRPTDTRGDQVADVLQVDMDGDGTYDGVNDQNVKWADNDGDGRADVQAWSTQPPVWGEGGKWSTAESHWMLFLDVEKDGVLGWQDWRKFDFGESNWAHDEPANWKPDYHGDALFLKIHRPPQALPDPRLNWENPFAFYDTDGDGLTEMAMRWLDPMTPVDKGLSPLSGVLNEAFLTFDLDNDSGKGNEIDYDMSLRGIGGPGVPYRSMGQSYPALRGNPKFDRCFQWGNWRQVDQLFFMPHDKSYDAFFGAGWKTIVLRLRRGRRRPPLGARRDVLPHARLRRPRGRRHLEHEALAQRQLRAAGDGGRGAEAGPQRAPPGRLAGRPRRVRPRQLGRRAALRRRLRPQDPPRRRGVGGVDGGPHGEFHGGWKAPGNRPSAPKVEEVVRYDDKDGNGFLDTVAYDYDGDRTFDLTVSLLDYATPADPHPDVVALVDTHREGWAGLHATFDRVARSSWLEALDVYNAAWRRGLTTPEIDALSVPSSLGERHANAYWLKEGVFRLDPEAHRPRARRLSGPGRGADRPRA